MTEIKYGVAEQTRAFDSPPSVEKQTAPMAVGNINHAERDSEQNLHSKVHEYEHRNHKCPINCAILLLLNSNLNKLTFSRKSFISALQASRFFLL